MKIIIFLICTIFIVSINASAKNFFANPSFKTWDKQSNQPEKSSWRWNCFKKKQKLYFEKIEQSSVEKHSGKYSLYIKDAFTGKLNNNIYWQMSPYEITKVRGKELQFSAWMKLIKASKSKVIGIGLWIKNKSGKTIFIKAGPEQTAETLWHQYIIKTKVPIDAQLIRAYFFCANGWGQTGEAYFDDISIAPVAPLKEKIISNTPVKSQASEDLNILKKTLLPGWELKSWGGLYIRNLAKEKILKVCSLKQSKAFAGVTIGTKAINRAYVLKNFTLDQSFVEFKMKPLAKIQIALHEGVKRKYIYCDKKYILSKSNGWHQIKIPLARFTELPINNLTAISIQFIKSLPPKTVIEFSDFVIRSFNPKAKVEKAVSSIVKNMTQKASKQIVFRLDSYSRPSIKNGTFYDKQQPVFLLGPWINNGLHAIDWGAKTKRSFMTDPIYDRLYDPSVAKILGMNSFQLSAAPSLKAKALLGVAISNKDINTYKEEQKFFKNLNGMPFVLDFAWINGIAKGYFKKNPEQKNIVQQNSNWHDFIPLCPENPKADKIYKAFFRTGTETVLQNKANPFVYEIFNESSYNCLCAYNRAGFIKKIQQKYNNIAKANATWGTKLSSFNELKKIQKFEKYKGVWADWCDFSGRKYVETLKRYKHVIQAVDKRSNIYFTEQLSSINIFTFTGAGMNYRYIAEEMDILGTEGGWKYGRDMNYSASDGMEAALASNNLNYSFSADFFSALAKNNKPVMNLEHYCGRFLFGKRYPSKATDIITSMWGEVMHGTSASFPYAWSKRIWEWETLEQAKKTVFNGGYKAFNLLNPYNWPRKSLDGFKTFSDELEILKNVVLPMPRQKQAKIALVYSYPSFIQSAVNKEDFEAAMINHYGALLYNHYPFQIVFEKDLNQKMLDGFELVVFPAIRNSYPVTLNKIINYVKSGGKIFCSSNAFLEDNYGQKINRSMLKSNRFKGKVFFSKNKSSNKQTSSILIKTLKKENVSKYCNIEALDGEAINKVEFQIIDRGDFKLIYLVNWADKGTRLINLKLQLNSGQKLYLSDFVDKKILLTKNNEEQWSHQELRKGVPVVLPPQERVLLTLSTRKDKSCKTWSFAQSLKHFNTQQKIEKSHLKKIRTEELKQQIEYNAARYYNDVKAKDCAFVDLTAHVNMGFKDDISGDGKGGWFDQGVNDFAKIPHGKVLMGNVPFNIIDPQKNKQKSAIVLYGKSKAKFPKKVTKINFNAKAKNIYFLHTMGWNLNAGETAFYYIVHYADGSKIKIPIRFAYELSGWWHPKAVSNAKIVFESSNSLCNNIGLYCAKWKNPKIKKKIAYIDIVSAEKNAVPAIIAISYEK